MKPDRVTWILVAILLALIAIELPFPHHAPVFPWHRLTGFHAYLGVAACVVVVIASKAIGKRLLQRPEREDDGA